MYIQSYRHKLSVAGKRALGEACQTDGLQSELLAGGAAGAPSDHTQLTFIISRCAFSKAEKFLRNLENAVHLLNQSCNLKAADHSCKESAAGGLAAAAPTPMDVAKTRSNWRKYL